MRFTRTAIILATAVALASPAPCAAQEPVTSFDQLNTRLKPGDTVWVTDAQGREVKGKVQALAPGELTVNADGARRFGARDVGAIRERKHDSLLGGAIIGGGAGALVGLGMGSFSGEWRWDDAAEGALIFGAIGAGIGVGIDALIPGRKVVTYRAPGTPGSSQARLSMAPVVTPRAKGVAVSFAF
jgi:hypothetical protein